MGHSSSGTADSSTEAGISKGCGSYHLPPHQYPADHFVFGLFRVGSSDPGAALVFCFAPINQFFTPETGPSVAGFMLSDVGPAPR